MNYRWPKKKKKVVTGYMFNSFRQSKCVIYAQTLWDAEQHKSCSIILFILLDSLLIWKNPEWSVLGCAFTNHKPLTWGQPLFLSTRILDSFGGLMVSGTILAKDKGKWCVAQHSVTWLVKLSFNLVNEVNCKKLATHACGTWNDWYSV